VSTPPGIMIEAHCSNCNRPYPIQGAPYRCPTCTAHYDIPRLPAFDLSQVDERLPGNPTGRLPGIWRYRHSFVLPDEAPVISLGEGNTPLIWRQAHGHEIGFKLEFLNPTGSYKDRGTAVLVSFLFARGVRQAVEDSSGNAGASFAAYAAAAGMQGGVFVPDYASGPKLAQIAAYGAKVYQVKGTRSQATQAALKAVTHEVAYASHAFMPFGLAGYATLAYELFQQMGQAPGTVITPVGQGGLLLGIGRGFAALQRAGLIDTLPKIIGVQALACAPLWALFTYGPDGLSWVSEGQTLAEGVRVRHPLRGDAVLQMVRQSGGLMLVVDEPDILPAHQALAQMGLFVEPTSAIVWKALEQAHEQLVDPVVVVLTGSGLKAV
jgi:threonine synthase